jgi:hypothetical protein
MTLLSSYKKTLVLIQMLAVVACAQRRIDPRNTDNHVICVAPLIGAGTADDPRRPQYAPWSRAATAAPKSPLPTDIIGFTQVPTDDGKFAIVKFRGARPRTFQAIFADATVTSFEKGVVGKTAIETALQKLKKDFDLNKLLAVGSLWASYQFYYTDNLTSIDLTKWTENGSVQPGPNWATGNGSLISTVAAPDVNDYDIRMTAHVNSQGMCGGYTLFAHRFC